MGATQPVVLVADDEPPVLFLIRATLERAGLAVLAASDEETAVRLCRNHDGQIDAAVLDVTMPGMKAMLTCLTERYPSARIVLASGYTREDVFARLGIDQSNIHFLQKPFTVQRLRDAVWNVVERSRTSGA